MDGEISAAELHTALESGDDVAVVDIRDPGSFEQGHIPDSKNLPFAELPQRVEELAGTDHIVTVCPLGKSSIKAARLIGSYEGIEGPVESLNGGLRGWEYELTGAAADSENAPF